MSKAKAKPGKAAPAAEGEKSSAPAGGGKKKLLLILLPVLLVAAGGGAWFAGLPPFGHKNEAARDHAAQDHAPQAHAGGEGAGSGESSGAHKEAEGKPKAPIFLDLPDIVANLNGGPRRATFVKLKAKIEVARPEDKELLTAAMPRILDLFQSYLREMRPEELRGAASTYRLREELTARTNLAAPPARAVAVLFTEMLVQ